jgi:hypothetical protein
MTSTVNLPGPLKQALPAESRETLEDSDSNPAESAGAANNGQTQQKRKIVPSVAPASSTEEPARKKRKTLKDVAVESKIEDDDEVSLKRLFNKSDRTMIANINKFEIRGKDFKTLLPRQMLNDEIMNGYFQLLFARRDRLKNDKRSIHLQHSFFWSILFAYENKYNYDKVRRWNKTLDLFSLDMILYVINWSNIHWGLVWIEPASKQIHYLDSITGNKWAKREVLKEGFVRFLGDEWTRLKKEDANGVFTPADWVMDFPSVPQQENASNNCGVAVLMMANYLSCDGKPDDAPLFPYLSGDLDTFRRSIALEIAAKRVDAPPGRQPSFVTPVGFETGQRVVARSHNNRENLWFHGFVIAVSEDDGALSIRYDDHQVEDDIPQEEERVKLSLCLEFKQGDVVEGRFEAFKLWPGAWYKGVVTNKKQVTRYRRAYYVYDIQYDDGDVEEGLFGDVIRPVINS